jgi:arsenate reductase-like glutaredoxin family protein
VDEDAALELVRDATVLLTKNGTSVHELDLQAEHPDDETLRRLVLGRSRTMRAPALRVRRTLMIGFDEDTYLELLGLE